MQITDTLSLQNSARSKQFPAYVIVHTAHFFLYIPRFFLLLLVKIVVSLLWIVFISEFWKMHLNQTTWMEKKSSQEFRAFVTLFCCGKCCYFGWFLSSFVMKMCCFTKKNRPLFASFDLFARFKTMKICYFFWFLQFFRCCCCSSLFLRILLVFLSFLFYTELKSSKYGWFTINLTTLLQHKNASTERIHNA